MDEDTIGYYERNVRAYAHWSRAIPVPRLWDLMTKRLPPRARILDAGCGAGRDLLELRERGLVPIGLDMSAGLLAEAQDYSRQPVVLGDLRALPFADCSMHGVWAVASLLHLPRAEVKDALREFSRVLRPGGVFLASLKEGEGARIDCHGRLFTFYSMLEWGDALQGAGFVIDQLGRDRAEVGRPLANEVSADWIVSLAEKPSG